MYLLEALQRRICRLYRSGHAADIAADMSADTGIRGDNCEHWKLISESAVRKVLVMAREY